MSELLTGSVLARLDAQRELDAAEREVAAAREVFLRAACGEVPTSGVDELARRYVAAVVARDVARDAAEARG